jgi:hypothetical protein
VKALAEVRWRASKLARNAIERAEIVLTFSDCSLMLAPRFAGQM